MGVIWTRDLGSLYGAYWTCCFPFISAYTMRCICYLLPSSRLGMRISWSSLDFTFDILYVFSPSPYQHREIFYCSTLQQPRVVLFEAKLEFWALDFRTELHHRDLT